MTKRIQEDHNKFRKVIDGKIRQELKKLIKAGKIVKYRPKGGKINISVPQIDLPRFVFGEEKSGVGRGQGKEGDVIDKKPVGKPGSAGDESSEGINVSIDMEDILNFMQEELSLPDMKPKENETFEEIKIKYNNISKNGPESLRHTRRTMREALKRLAMTGKLNELKMVPSSKVPIRIITPINSDRRYRQYNEVKIPSSNAVILFARDCSASMDDYKCGIVSDMSWWIDCWIKKFYDKVERSYFVHDAKAKEVNEKDFYTYRMGGGTVCSSIFELISEQIKNKYPPNAYNIYFFYFTDGENISNDDNEKIIQLINENLGVNHINMIGITQVCSIDYRSSVKQFFDEKISNGVVAKNVRTANIGDVNSSFTGVRLSDEDRNNQIFNAIKKLLSESKTV